MRRVVVLLGVLMMTLMSGVSFGYFEKKLFCNIDNKRVTINLKQKDPYIKCQSYLDKIRQLALQKYNEIMLIRYYISQGDDVIYRKNIQEVKESELLQLVNYKNQIEYAISDFESKFFEQYQAYLQDPMRLYYSDLEVEYYILINQERTGKDGGKIDLRLSQIEQQMWNVNHIIQAKNLDEIMEVVPNYIYLKKQLLGK